MADESDGIDEALEGDVRLAVTAGARIGAEIARARQEQLREQRRMDERAAGRLAERYETEKRIALTELAQVHRPDWWDRADAERIGQAYATARAWAPEAPDAARAEQTMRDQLQARYGIDPTRVDPRTVGAEVDAWQRRLEQQHTQQAHQERVRGAAEQAEAAALQAAADDRRDRADDRTWEGRGDRDIDAAEVLYDSADRRAADARAMEAQGVEPAVAESRMRADTGRAAPATLATAGAGRGRRAAKARKSRGSQLELPGIER